VIFGLMLCVCALPQSDDEVARTLAIALRAAGVVRTEAAEPRTEKLRVADFVEASWNTPGDGFGFVALPGLSAYFDGDVESERGDELAWRDKIAPWTWGDTQPVLRLVQEGESPRASARLELSHPRSAGGPAAGPVPSRIVRVDSGCPMTHEFELPVEIGNDGVALEFSWDLHTPVQLDRRRLNFGCDVGVVPGVAIELVEPAPLVVVEPRRLVFEDGVNSRVRVTHPRGRGARLDRILHASCVRLVEVSEIDDGWELRFAETQTAESRHECNAVRVDIVLDGDPEPFERFAGVRHVRPIRDENAARVLWSAFAPGEHCEAWSNGTNVRFAHPDRLPCCANLLASFGYRRLAEFDVAGAPGVVDLALETSEGLLRILGVAGDSTVRDMDDWGEVCTR